MNTSGFKQRSSHMLRLFGVGGLLCFGLAMIANVCTVSMRMFPFAAIASKMCDQFPKYCFRFSRLILIPLFFVLFFQTQAAAVNIQPPTLVSPGSSSSPGPTLTLTPTFQWQQQAGAAGYGLYIRDMVSNTIVYPNASAITSTPLQGTSFTLPSGYLQAGGQYRWNMTSFSSTGEYTPPAGTNPSLYFQTQAAAINIQPPTLVSPGSSSSPGPTLTLTPTFQWQQQAGATGYGLYIRDMVSNTIVYPNASATTSTLLQGTSFTLPSGYLQAGGQYRWNMTSFSTTWEYTPPAGTNPSLYFQTQAAAINIQPPTLVSPGSSSSPGPTLTLTPTFQWQQQAGATGYGLYIRDMVSNTIVYPNASATTSTPLQGTSFTLPSGYLQAGGQYRWNMTSFSSTGEYTPPAGTNPSLYFQTQAAAINIQPPTLVSPGSSSSPGPTLTLTPTFQWQQQAGATGYGLYIRDMVSNTIVYPNASATTSTPLQGTSFTLPSGYLQAGGQYRWNMTSFSTTWEYTPPAGTNPVLYFQTQAAAINIQPPTLVSPGSSSSPGPTLTLTPTFQWQQQAGAAGYGLYIRDMVSNTIVYPNASAITSTPLQGTSFTLPSGYLQAGHQYKWNMTSFSGTTLSMEYVPLTNPSLYFQTPAATSYSLSGTIKDSVTGSPLVGVWVTHGQKETTTDATGYYFIGQLANASQTINVSLTGYKTQSPIVNPATTPTKDFQLAPDPTACTSGTVQGTVNDASTGELKSSVIVTLNNSITTTTNASGHYTFSNVASGTRTLSVSLLGYSSYGQNAVGCGDATLPILLAKTEAVQGMQIKSGLSPDPVNTATGNYVYQRQDLKLPGKGFGFVFERTYNSQEASSPTALNGPLGFGWSHAYNVRTVNTSSGVDIRWGDSKVESYTSNGSGGFTPPYGVFDTLAAAAGGAYTLTKKNHMVYFFDASGRLASITDRNGNTLTLTYTGSNLSSITDTSGRNISFSYDAVGHLNKIMDPINRTVQFAYDTAGNMVSATDARGQTTQYGYDAAHQLLTVTDPRGNAVVTNTYDGEKRVVTVQKDAKGGTTNYEYDPLNHVTTFTDALGHTITHHFDDHLQLIREDDPNGGIARYKYDGTGNRIEVADKNGNPTSYEYDTKGNVTKKADALQQATTVTYSASNDPLTRRDALGQTTTYTYDSKGNLTSTTDPLNQLVNITYDASGLPLAVTDARGNATTNAYDAQGNLTSVTDALGNITSYTYDGVGRRISKKDALNRTTTYAYDTGDNMLSTTDPTGKTVTNAYDENGNRVSVTDKRGSTTQFTYDQKDLLTTTTDILGQQLIYGYDALDRRISVKDKRGNSTVSTYDALGNLRAVTDALNGSTQYSYDLNGNRIKSTDQLGHDTNFAYDALNRRTATTDALANMSITTYDAIGRVNSTTNAKGQVTSFEYDTVGRLTKVTDASGGTVAYTYDANGNRLTMTDPQGKVTSYAYNKLNRLITKTEPLANITQYEYDGVGNLKKITHPNGNIIQYAYDALNRISTIAYPDATGVSFAYDANGNRTQVTNAAGTSAFTYDVLDRMLSYTDPFSQQVGYGYDVNGNRTSLTYPGNKTATYTYDELNRMSGVTDWQGRNSSYSYDAASRLAQTLNPNGTSATLGYDNANRLTQLTNAGSSQTISIYAYTLDPLGNHRQTTVNEPLAPSIAKDTVNYSYDDENRLTGAGGVSFTYDADGNLTAKGPDTFVYDFEDRLKQSTIGGVAASYQYDGVGNRLAKTVGGTTVRYVLDLSGNLSKVLMETDSANTPTAYYLYGLGLVARIKSDGTANYYHYDSRGSTVALSDQTGNITDKYAYDPFGKPAGSQGATANPFKYVGRYGVMDEGNGLTYVRARYYDPDSGRFISKDPKTGNDQDGQSLNRYVYALNNPIRLLDVSGLSPLEGSGVAKSGTSDVANSPLIGETLPSNTGSVQGAGDWFLQRVFGAAKNYLAEEAIHYAVTHATISIGLRISNNATRVGNIAGNLGALVTPAAILWSGWEEFQSRGHTWSDLVNSWANIGPNVKFAMQNPDAALQAGLEGTTSATAVLIPGLTGQDIQSGTNWFVNAVYKAEGVGMSAIYKAGNALSGVW